MKINLHYVIILLLLLCISGCGEIEFEPSIPPLELGTISPNRVPGTVILPDQQIPTTQPSAETLNAIEPIDGFNSEQAMEICSEELSWGDTERGGCLQPGGSKHYLWINPEEVIEIEINISDPNLLGFLLATDNRAGALEDFHDDRGSLGVSVIALIIEVPVTGAACTTVLGCVGGVTLLSITGYYVIDNIDSVAEDLGSFAESSIQVKYYYCRIQGNSDQACRDAYNIGSSEIGEPND